MKLTPGRPAEKLNGLTLDGGWVVESIIVRPPNATGGAFSVPYTVRNGKGENAFLKALDLTSALASPDPTSALQALTEAFNFERDLLRACNRMDRVITVIADGTAVVDNTPLGRVPYLIMELADGDVRARLARIGRFDTAWILRCLHHVATGLLQLHRGGVAHQDLKPSNILTFGSGSKIGDVGRASRIDRTGPYDAHVFAGDYAYAPPELLYNVLDPDFRRRRFSCDHYLLGSMVVFFFTQVSMTGLLFTNLPEAFQPSAWGDSYDNVLSYLTHALSKAVDEFAQHIGDDKTRIELSAIVGQLCNPDPSLRGSTTSGRLTSMLSLEQIVSKFDFLASRAESGLTAK
jgi:serine/threonine protein kinase